MGHDIKLSFVPNTATSKQTPLITNQIIGHICKYMQTPLITNQIIGHICKYICNCSNDRFLSSKWKVISAGCCVVVQ